MYEKYELKEYNIFMDGFSIQGMEGQTQGPSFVGKSKGRNFQDACFRFYLKKELEKREQADINNSYYDTKRFDYDSYRNSYWGCALGESIEELANKSR